MRTTVETVRASSPPAGWRLSQGDELVTLVLSVWLITGLFIDGWAHNNLQQLETFFTPWHAVFYSGFAAVAAWIGFQVVRGQESGRRGRSAVPVGYGLGVIGVAIFAVGGVGDMIWHVRFGVEQSLDALLSPTHLLLLIGIALIVTSPLRAAWASADDRDAARLRTFLPVVLSLTLVTALVSFFFMYLSAFIDKSPVLNADRWPSEEGPYPGDFFVQLQGITSVLVTNAILLAPVLYLLRRWHPPFGTVTVLFTAIAVLMNGLIDFEMVWSIPPATVAGLIADLLIRRLRPAPERPTAYRLVATLTPAVLWSGYYLALGLGDPIVWVPELWSGTIFFSALTGLVLAQLMLPVARPPARAARGFTPESVATEDVGATTRATLGVHARPAGR